MLPRGRGVNGLIRRPTPLDTKETHVEPQDASGQLLTGGRGRRRPRARERSPGTGSHANGRSGKRLCSRPALLLFVSSLTADKRLLRNHENVLTALGWQGSGRCRSTPGGGCSAYIGSSHVTLVLRKSPCPPPPTHWTGRLRLCLRHKPGHAGGLAERPAGILSPGTLSPGTLSKARFFIRATFCPCKKSVVTVHPERNALWLVPRPFSGVLHVVGPGRLVPSAMRGASHGALPRPGRGLGFLLLSAC